MFTPEFTSEKDGTFTLVANHALEDPKARQLSIDYNLARIRFGLTQLPPRISKSILVYDIRGQRIGDDVIASLKSAFAQVHELRFMK
jgi:hypothetical protein